MLWKYENVGKEKYLSVSFQLESVRRSKLNLWKLLCLETSVPASYLVWHLDLLLTVNTVLHLCMPERTEEQHMNTTYLGPFVICCWGKFHNKIAYVLLMALLCYKADESFPCSSVYWAQKVQNSLWSNISSLWHSFVNWPPLDPVSGQKGYACSCLCSWGQFFPLFDLQHLNLHNIFD